MELCTEVMALRYCGNFILSLEVILLKFTKLKLHVNVLLSLGLLYSHLHSVPAINVKVGHELYENMPVSVA